MVINRSKRHLPIAVHVERPSFENGVVLTCGMGDVGQLGLGEDVEEKTRPGLVPDLENIVAVAAGGLHSVVVDKDGKVGLGARGMHGCHSHARPFFFFKISVQILELLLYI